MFEKQWLASWSVSQLNERKFLDDDEVNVVRTGACRKICQLQSVITHWVTSRPLAGINYIRILSEIDGIDFQ